jgi:hypothetical protein
VTSLGWAGASLETLGAELGGPLGERRGAALSPGSLMVKGLVGWMKRTACCGAPLGAHTEARMLQFTGSRCPWEAGVACSVVGIAVASDADITESVGRIGQAKASFVLLDRGRGFLQTRLLLWS